MKPVSLAIRLEEGYLYQLWKVRVLELNLGELLVLIFPIMRKLWALLDDFIVNFAFFLSDKIVTLCLVLEGYKSVTVLENLMV
jgi:hypothetical protein